MEVPRTDFAPEVECARAWCSRPKTKRGKWFISWCRKCGPKPWSSTSTIPWRAKSWKFLYHAPGAGSHPEDLEGQEGCYLL